MVRLKMHPQVLKSVETRLRVCSMGINLCEGRRSKVVFQNCQLCFTDSMTLIWSKYALSCIYVGVKGRQHFSVPRWCNPLSPSKKKKKKDLSCRQNWSFVSQYVSYYTAGSLTNVSSLCQSELNVSQTVIHSHSFVILCIQTPGTSGIITEIPLLYHTFYLTFSLYCMY